MSEKLGQLDLVFVVDNTGSMGPYINEVKRKILEIIRTIKKEELCHRLRVGLVSYRDHPPEDMTFVTRKYELTPDTAKIEQNVREMLADGGGDGPEAVADALNAVNRMEFLTESAKVVVLIGDAPPHGVEEGDRWSVCPEGISWEDEIHLSFDKGIVVHTVGCYPEIEGYKRAVEVFKRIASESRGKFFPLTDAGLLVQLITGIAVEEIDKVAIQQSILEELGVTAEQLPDAAEMDDAGLRSIASKISASGFTKRAVRHVAAGESSPSAPRGKAAERVEVEQSDVDEEDVREALRQLKKKSSH